MVSVFINNKNYLNLQSPIAIVDVKNEITTRFNIPTRNFYILNNGKIAKNEDICANCSLHVVHRLFGGKGGFGSMLRAIGAQIEKTTNREACRDLSGRRLRDINEEKRLKTWIAQQAEREKDADDRRQKKLERLVQKPKHEFKDENYEKERQLLPEKAEDALEQGLKASCSSTTVKRKLVDNSKGKKKARLWMDEDLSVSEGSESDDSECADSSNSQNKDKATESTNKTDTNDTVGDREVETVGKSPKNSD